MAPRASLGEQRDVMRIADLKKTSTPRKPPGSQPMSAW
jgi:hypothetical protein